MKWTLVNNFNVWSRKMWLLIDQIREDEPEFYETQTILRMIRHEILGPFLKLDDLR